MVLKGGTLVLKVVARAQNFVRGMKTSRKELVKFRAEAKKTSSVMQRLKGGLGKGLAAAGITLGLGATVGLFKRLAQGATRYGDQLNQVSQKLGIQTQKLAELRFAAAKAGVSQQNLELSLQRMVRRVAEAAVGTGEAQGALRELGIDAKELSQLTPDRMLLRVARSLSTVTNRSTQLRLAFKLFDSEGVGLINLLDRGDQGIQQLAERFRDLKGAVGGPEFQRAKEFWIDISTRMSGFAERFTKLVIKRTEQWGGVLDHVKAKFKDTFNIPDATLLDPEQLRRDNERKSTQTLRREARAARAYFSRLGGTEDETRSQVARLRQTERALQQRLRDEEISRGPEAPPLAAPRTPQARMTFTKLSQNSEQQVTHLQRIEEILTRIEQREPGAFA